MSLLEKVRSVEDVFRDLDRAIATFQSWSTLHCNTGCGKCCFKADLEATALEFLPLAHQLYERGEALAWLEKFESGQQEYCHVLNPVRPGSGLCSEYLFRGLICRLFGYSARTNKYAKRELVTCQIIKSEQPEAYRAAQEKMITEPIPVISDYYMRLRSIDPELARDFYPVNQAIRRAIETVLQYYAYRN